MEILDSVVECVTLCVAWLNASQFIAMQLSSSFKNWTITSMTCILAFCFDRCNFNLMILVARAAWYGGVWRRQLRPAGSGDAGLRRADAFADLSDAHTDANTDASAGYDAGALRERGHGNSARAARDRAAPTARVRSMAAPPELRRRQRGWRHRVRASAGGVAGRAARAVLRKRHCLRPRRALNCGWKEQSVSKRSF
jgi:hypothetical protein